MKLLMKFFSNYQRNSSAINKLLDAEVNAFIPGSKGKQSLKTKEEILCQIFKKI